MYVWVIVAALVVYVGFRFLRNRSSGGSSAASPLPDAAGTPGVDAGTGTTNPGDSGSGTGSIDTAQLASDLAAALQDQMPQGDTTGAVGDRTPSPDVPILPGTFPEKPPGEPGLPKPQPKPQPKPKSPAPTKEPPKHKPKKPPTKPPHKYYTYKKDVPLSKGQTVHYTPGKGYYAA
jgi:outer membrane biosynthesis protein TonB